MHPDDVTWITDRVAITNFVSAHDQAVLAREGVRAVLCLDRGLAGCAAKERGVKCVRTAHLVDGANERRVFERAVEALEELVGRYERVVVHCRAGRSRSVAVVAAYLRKSLHIEAQAALSLVTAKRETAIAPELVRLVEQFVP